MDECDCWYIDGRVGVSPGWITVNFTDICRGPREYTMSSISLRSMEMSASTELPAYCCACGWVCVCVCACVFVWEGECGWFGVWCGSWLGIVELHHPGTNAREESEQRRTGGGGGGGSKSTRSNKRDHGRRQRACL